MAKPIQPIQQRSSQPKSPVGGLVDHGLLDLLLQRHVRDRGVDYQGFSDDLDQLDDYLQRLASIELGQATRAQLLCFYINAYNACTIRLILKHYGTIKSIRDIRRPWQTREWRLAGETLSLDEIEHKKLRRQLREPRCHFAIVCASRSCPDLADRAYTESSIDSELDAAATRFISTADNLRFEVDSGLFGPRYRLFLSRIFKWYRQDFTLDGRQLWQLVADYAPAPIAEQIRTHGDRLSIRYLPYSWRLNNV